MKTLFLFTITIFLSLNLSARENPFAQTNAYEEEKARIIEQKEVTEEEASNASYVREMQEKMNNLNADGTIANKNKVKKAVEKLKPALKVKKPVKPKPKTYSKHEVNKLIKKAQKQTEAKTRAIVKKELSKTPTKAEQIVYVKPRTDIIEDEKPMMMNKKQNLKLLPFVSISYDNNKLTIHTKDKVSKKFSLDKENKIIIDYKAMKNFYTKRADLKSENFSKIAIGNHKKDRIYRVVVKLAAKPSNYLVKYENGLMTITDKRKN